MKTEHLPPLRTLVTLLLYIVLTVAAVLGIRYLLPVIMPFLFGLGVASLVQRPAALLSSRLPRLSHKTCCLLLTAALLLIATALLSVLICSLAGNFVSFCPDIPAHMAHARRVIAQAASSGGDGSWGRFVGALATGAGWTMDFLSENYRQYVPSVLARSGGMLRRLPSLVTAVFFGGLAALFACGDLPRLRRTFRELLPPEASRTVSRLLHAAARTVAALLRTYGTLMGITMAELTAGFSLIRLMGYDTGPILTAALVISLVDVLPVLGTGTVLIPWGLLEILTGSPPLGLMLLGMAVIIGLVRNYLEPKLIARRLRLPPFLTLAAVYTGGKLFGAAGILLLPLLLLTAREYADDAKNAADP
ncbi:MAG: AI-2E family transporter [Clostridia bacterium]|nr:AI-2E family transporter [Clostridia bacterium]MBQ1553899.1 AI-2E family transporter [Clostridia bacterium]MBQ4395972.1 AI-2E family transporter [Clostridia bacterium]